MSVANSLKFNTNISLSNFNSLVPSPCLVPLPKASLPSTTPSRNSSGSLRHLVMMLMNSLVASALPSSNSMATTVSLNARTATSDSSSHTSTTLASQLPIASACMRTPLLFTPSSTNHLVPSTCRVSIMPLFTSVASLALTSTSMPSTTTFSASWLEWAA